ncbi:MAG: hypothetical protein ACR2L1_01720, partial [Pyrinomonadaceae bacterium]
LSEVERVAKKYLQPDKIAIVVVGDAEEILKQVKPYATNIDAFNTEGKPVDIANYGKAVSAPTVNVTGMWDLTLEVQGQKLPVSLDLKQDAGKVTGSLDSMLGKGAINNGKIIGNKINAVAKTEMQGQSVDLNLSGTVEGDTMKGVITASMPGLPPISFEGKRRP